jgi:hypothetical protein
MSSGDDLLEQWSDNWEIEYGDMILDEEDGRWKPSPYILDLLADGWEPFSVTNMFRPQGSDGYSYSERIWFKRVRMIHANSD